MAWLNTDWLHRKQVNITGQTGAGTNYQVLLKIGESSGAAGADFHLEGNSADFPAAKDDGGDLRFTAADGTTLLDFWVEKVEGSGPNRTAWVWVEVSADLGSNQSIYCYYANSSAPSNGSNGDNTFLFFDDFNAALDTTTKWTVGGASPSQSGTELTLNAGPVQQRITSQTKWTTGIAARWYFKNSSLRKYGLGGAGLASGAGYYDAAVDGVGGWFYNNTGQNNNGKHYSFDKGGAQSAAVYSGSWDTNYHTWEARRVAGSKSALYLDDSLAGETTNTTYITAASIGAFASMRDGCTGVADWVCVRKFQLSEPDFSTAGSQEDASTTYNQDVIATASITAIVRKQVPKTIVANVSAAAPITKKLAETLTAAVSGSAIINASRLFVQELTAAVGAAATITAKKIKVIVLTASAVGSASITNIKSFVRTLSAAVDASASVSTIKNFVRTLTASATGAAEVATDFMYGVVLTASVRASATITRVISASVVLTAMVEAVAKVKDVFFRTKYTRQNDDYTRKY